MNCQVISPEGWNFFLVLFNDVILTSVFYLANGTYFSRQKVKQKLYTILRIAILKHSVITDGTTEQYMWPITIQSLIAAG